MIDGGYLIPANTKKGQLIFGVFTPPDLIMFGIGVGISLFALLIVGANDTMKAIICLLPALFTAFLVLPIPNYRNVRTFFTSMINFLTGQRIYRWRGWCLYEQREIKK